MRVRLKGINTVRRKRADGSYAVYHYHRATGLRLEGEPGSPQFLDSYAAAERSMQARELGTFGEMIRRFEESPEFGKFAEATKREYTRRFKIIDAKWGTCPIAGLTDREFRKDVLAWRDEIATRGLREADSIISALARVLSYGVDRSEIDTNVLENVRRLYRSNRAEKIWLPEHVAAFTKGAPEELCAALMLAMHTGQRQGDLLRLPWSAYDGTRVTLHQRKGGKTVSIRCTKALKRMLDSLEKGKKGPLILTTKTGRAWKKRYFAEQWQEASKAAGITDLHFHDLRGTAVTMLAEAGSTVPEIASVTGHSFAHVTRILEVYLPRTRALADAAIMKLEKRARRLKKAAEGA